MKTLQIDEKWSVQYDPSDNDRPAAWMRCGEPAGGAIDNLHRALFYALLEQVHTEETL